MKKISPEGRVYEIVYDSEDRPVELKAYPDGVQGDPIRTYEYHPDTAETVIFDREGNPTVFKYDCVLDKWLNRTDALGYEGENTFDEYGNAETSTGPCG